MVTTLENKKLGVTLLNSEINSFEFLCELRGNGKQAQRAFRKLVNETHAGLTRFLNKHIYSKESVQEALQETYLGVHKGIHAFEAKCRLTTWIFSLAYRKACDALAQKYQAQNFLLKSDFEIESIQDLETRFLAPDETYYQARLVQEVMSEANQLPALYREAYQLRDVDGLSGEEAAIVLGISPTLLRVRVHRARTLIVGRLQKKLPSLFENLVKS